MRSSNDATVWWFISSGLFLFLAVAASAQSGDSAPRLEAIVAGMAQGRAENQARLRPYVVTRVYVLSGKKKDKTKSEVTAEIAFTPPNFKKYSIRESNGSGLGERLVRRILEAETQIVKDYGTTDISPANYDFLFVGQEDVAGRRCFVLELLPKREDKTLLRGTMWVDADTFLLRRIEAEPAKGPSWWLRNVRLAFFYGDVGGMWLQTSSEYTTHVRIFGQHTMTSRDVKYETAELADAGGLGPKSLLPSQSDQDPRCSAPCASVSSRGVPPDERAHPHRTR